MKRFFHSSGFKTLVVIAVVMLLGVLCAVISHNAASPFTTAVGTVFSPLQKLSAAIEENLGEGFVDSATLVVPSREKFGGACVATDTDGDTAIIKTAEIIINISSPISVSLCINA